MKRYKDTNGDSGIIAYEVFDSGIRVVFRNNMMYTYSKKLRSGQLDEMIRLAQNGDGLNSYIMKNVSKLYDKSEKIAQVIFDEF